ncbi:hypothetical protein [Mesorhizobium sp.]|uniref:hypothetical protein n=1 Tax=Mesorhizobium sp. TaxID=1871066 RepID=UPI000FE8CCCD|nr:hypothetical protein [Mesorhizobium sp.]RWA97328.1 MAG: hypothetical protein EOQ33_32025 [Mesorhizobium sp.]
MAEIDHASILFPNDAPSKPAQMPEGTQVQHAAAEQRLVGNHGKPDAAAAAMFPSERKAEASPPAGKDDDDASILFRDDAAREDVDYERAVGGELDQFTLDAMKDGDTEQASALKAATAALSEDFRASGTDPASIHGPQWHCLRRRNEFPRHLAASGGPLLKG